MPDHLIRKLERFVRLSTDDENELIRIASERTFEIAAHQDIIAEGARPRAVNLILVGWAVRYKLLEDGRRQILSFLVPGDLCDLNVYILRQMDHSVGAITQTRVAELAPALFERVQQNFPRIAQALLWDALVTLAIQREWTVSLGQRSAFERIAHLLCELFLRLQVVGLTNGQSARVPITQVDLASAAGLSQVHVNRSLQELRRQGLIRFGHGILEIPDLNALKRTAMFSDNYLHLGHEGAHLDANRVSPPSSTRWPVSQPSRIS